MRILATIFLLALAPANFAAFFARGHVLSETGAPLANIPLFAYANGAQPVLAFSGPDGAFEISLSVGTWFIDRADQPPPGLLFPHVPAFIENADANDVELRTMVSDATITALLKTTSGQPVAGVTLSAAGVIAGSKTYISAPATTDAAGKFTLQVTAGTWFLNFRCDELSAKNLRCPANTIVMVSAPNVNTEVTVAPLNSIASPTLENPTLIETANGPRLRFILRGAPAAYFIESTSAIPFAVFLQLDRIVIPAGQTTATVEVDATRGSFYRAHVE